MPQASLYNDRIGRDGLNYLCADTSTSSITSDPRIDYMRFMAEELKQNGAPARGDGLGEDA